MLRQRTVSSTAQQFADRLVPPSRLTLKHGVGRPIAAAREEHDRGWVPTIASHGEGVTLQIIVSEERVRWRERAREKKVRGMGRRLTWNRGTLEMVPPCARAIARKVRATIRVRLKLAARSSRSTIVWIWHKIRIQDFHLDCPRWHLGGRADTRVRHRKRASRAPPPRPPSGRAR